MWRYEQPGFALHLLYELQKQQQCSLHCDTLLQTEGVSIPAHSCVLSALSPVFCRAFANVPSLPVGQSRVIQLEAVGAHALMKLVGFVYSGEMEGESLDDQQEVIEIAYRLGFSNIMQCERKQVKRHQNKTAGWREIGLQTEEGERKKDASVHILSEKQSFSHLGIQTDSTEAQFADTCFASEPELSIDLPDELTDVPSHAVSPDSGLAWINGVVAHSPSDRSETLVRVHARHQQTHKEKKRAKISKKQQDTHISLKIKLKRQKSGALWEIVSVQEESAVDGSYVCKSSDAPSVTHSLVESSADVQLSSSSSLTYQNLETVTLTPPSELTTPLFATPTRTLSDHFSLHTPHPMPLLSPPQIPPLSPNLSQPTESDEHIAKLLERITMGLKILPSVAVEENSGMHTHLDQKLKKCSDVDNPSASELCLLGHNLGAVGSRTTSGAYEQKETGSEDVSSCRKSDLKNVASLGSYPALPSHPSPCSAQKKNIDSSFTPPCSGTDFVPFKHTFRPEHQNVFELKTAYNNFCGGADPRTQTVSDSSEDFSEMRLPRCLSPLASESGKTTGISTQDPLRPLEFSSCLSTSHVNRQPALRYESSPIQPQALPGKTNPQNSSCTSLHVNELHCSMVQKNSWPISSNEDHNVSVEQKTKMPDPDNGLLKGKENNIQERQMNESEVRGLPTPRYSVETDNEPYRKKAKMSGYTNGADTQRVMVVKPCSVKIKNISHSDYKQNSSDPLTSQKMDCLKAVKKNNPVSIDLKSQEKRALCQMSKGHEECRKDVGDANPPASLVVKHGQRSFLQKRTSETLMEDLRKISKLNNSSAVLNTLSSSNRHDLQLTRMSTESTPKHGSLTQPVPEVKNLADQCEKNKVEMEKVILDVNLNTEECKQPKMYACLAKKASFCDKIFHQSVLSVGTAVTHDISHQPRSIFQTTDRNLRTSLPPSLNFKKLRRPPEPDHMNAKLMVDNSKKDTTDTREESGNERGVPGTDQPNEVLDKAKGQNIYSKRGVDQEQVKSSSRSVKGSFVRETANPASSIYEAGDLNAAFHLCMVPPEDFGMGNNLQHESKTVLHSFENMIEKPTERLIPKSFSEAPVSNKPAEIKLIQTNNLHIEETEGIRVVNMEEQDILSKEKEKENIVRKTGCVKISRMNEYDDEISDLVMNECTQRAADQSDEVVATGGNTHDTDVMGSQMCLEVDNDGEVSHEEEFSNPQVLRTEVEAMQPDEVATVERTSFDSLSSSAVFLPDVNAESAENCSSSEEELVVDDISDSPVQACTVTGIRYNCILDEEEEEEEEVDVTGEESD